MWHLCCDLKVMRSSSETFRQRRQHVQGPQSGRKRGASRAQEGGPWCLDHREPEKSSPRAEEGLEPHGDLDFLPRTWKVSYWAEMRGGGRRGAGGPVDSRQMLSARASTPCAAVQWTVALDKRWPASLSLRDCDCSTWQHGGGLPLSLESWV